MSFLTDKALEEFDEGLVTGMILIDLQMAFGTIDHEILLQKCKAIKFSKSTIKWFKSYLSDFGEISCGVPQRSILGPLLFLIYITSILSLYAGDSCILYQHKAVTQIKKTAQSRL